MHARVLLLCASILLLCASVRTGKALRPEYEVWSEPERAADQPPLPSELDLCE